MWTFRPSPMRWVTGAEGRYAARSLAAQLCLLVWPLLAWGQGGWWEDGRPAPVAHRAVALLETAASHGLAPEDYGAGALRAAVAAAEQGPFPSPAQAAGLTSALNAALLRYLQHLHAGRIDPRVAHQRVLLPEPARFDAASALHEALASGRLDMAVDAAVPRLQQYEALRLALLRYRELAGQPAWGHRLPALPPAAVRGRAATLEAGQPWPGLEALALRLRLLGDLMPDAAAAPAVQPPQAAVYAGALVDAVKAFQRRHGLVDDGVIGRATWQALQVLPAQRVRQIELSLERLRWTPLLQGPRMIVINVPEFVLRAYEVDRGQIQVKLAMKVIVGRARANRTPLFSEPMRRIEFSPYWNVPASIARHELVPQLRRSPSDFSALGYEFVTGRGEVVSTLRPELLDAVLAGNARIRQRPGPKNALGDIKFVFPNNDAIYLHHTPAVDLFQRDRRDFSHGCIRLEDPLALARFVLARRTDWPEERIRAAMAAGSLSQLVLDEPLPVLITYGTALAVQGQVHFFEDIYGHDAELARALRQQRLPPLPSPTAP